MVHIFHIIVSQVHLSRVERPGWVPGPFQFKDPKNDKNYITGLNSIALTQSKTVIATQMMVIKALSVRWWVFLNVVWSLVDAQPDF